MDNAAKRHESERETAHASKDSYVCNDLVNCTGSEGLQDNGLSLPEEDRQSRKPSNEKDVEATVEPPVESNGLVASEDYSVFTIPQKRAIILAGSFISWFSPMTGAIYYPALDQVCCI